MKKFKSETLICYQCDTAFDAAIPLNSDPSDILCLCPGCAYLEEVNIDEYDTTDEDDPYILD